MRKNINSLETDRLMLREIEKSDASFVVRLRSDPQVYQYFLSPRPITEEDHLRWYFRSYRKDHNRIDFIVVEKGSGEKIGVFNIKRDSGSMYCSEIGYLLDKSAQGKGYAKEGIKRLMIFSKVEWECRQTVFHIHEQNIVSRTLAERLGFTVNGKEGNFMLYQIDLENMGGGYNS